jgi:hypothetical protein
VRRQSEAATALWINQGVNYRTIQSAGRAALAAAL